jgi:multiple sugar transport system permease protein
MATGQQAPTRPFAGMLTSVSQRSRLGKIALYVFLTFFALLTLLPIAWMLSTSLKAQADTFQLPIQWIPDQLMWRNYPDAWNNPQGDAGFGRFTINSLVVAGGVTVIHVFLASLAGYGLAKYKFYGRHLLFLAFLATLMLPVETIMVPLFMTTRSLGMLDSYQGLILPTVADAFGILLMRQAFVHLPNSLIEAARIDGAGDFRIFASIAMRLSWPAVATLTIFIFRETFDSFLWPLLITTSGDMYTIPLGIRQFEVANLTNYPQIMAISALATIPAALLFFGFQKSFVRGIAMVGIKE